ncbi:hypothetical protein BP6252_09110 [Coleophoma cylindrospora]|uniref:Pentatricopeptide repeat-containing protein n=1 Tax=Coleophoma cylindrospora TaxID=1849047 RepID=A0A3D8R1K7_9HELO|nr:hypothetical protein BP6252_09110 [Coleophoma cylindrospora]
MSKLMNLIKPTNSEDSKRAGSPQIEDLIDIDETTVGSRLLQVPTSFAESLRVPLSPYKQITFSEDQQVHDYTPKIATFNEHLHRVWKDFPKVLEGASEKDIAVKCSKLWRSYVLCRRGLLTAPKDVPGDVWWVLWEVFSSEAKWNTDRLPHIKILAEDISTAGQALPDSASLLYVEALFVSGDQENAIQLWEMAEDPYDERSMEFKKYWTLGAQMLAKNGQIDRAMEVAEILLGNTSEPENARILLPIIWASLNSEVEYAVQKAWALYVRFRVIMGPLLTMDDYDSVISGLLNANQGDLALRVFSDMMLTGSQFELQQDSTAQYQNVLGGKNLKNFRIKRTELTWEDSKALATLPKQFNNKYFFGKWMKKLIGDGELDLAHKVLHIMFQRGIRPDAKYINGLIGAWLRSGTKQDEQLAENLAWRMIDARLQFVKQRQGRQQFEGPVRAVVSVPDKKDHKTILGVMPNATIETFGLLVENYSRRVENTRVLEIYETLERAQIPANTFFLNQLLGVEIRSHNRFWAWENYTRLVQENGVRPDFDTFRCLWHLMQKQSDPALTRGNKNFTTCRMLFAEMIRCAPILRAQEEMPRELYGTILLSFGLGDDQIGTAIALRALQSHFDMYPTPETARSVILQLSRVGRLNRVGLRPRRLKLDNTTRKRVDAVTNILATFKDRRVEELAKQGLVFDEITGDAKLEESLMLLCDILGYVASGRLDQEAAEDLAQLTKTAAEEMGLPDHTPWRAQAGQD